MIDLETKTERLADGTHVVSVAGELDLYTAPAFERELLAALDGGAETIVVDLTACEFFDSTALGVLLSTRKALADSPGGVSLVTSDRSIRKILEITGCAELFPLHASRVAALNGGLHRSSWVDEEAKTRAMFRVVNERIAELGEGFQLAGRTPFVCECGNRDCLARIELTRAEYETVRAHSRRFVLAVDHENPAVEIVVSDNGRFAVAETLVGEESRIPEETDPRHDSDAGAAKDMTATASASELVLR